MHGKKYIVYLTTNIINGKQYVGDHAVKNIDDKYMGSGAYLHYAIKKYGKKNFKREILEFFPSRKEAFNAQEKYINEYNTLQPNGYNISPTGGLHENGHHSEETKKQIAISCSKALKGIIFSEEHINKIAQKAKLRKWINNKKESKSIYLENLQEYLNNGWKLGRLKFSAEHCSNISKIRKEKKIAAGKNNGMFGKHHTTSSKLKSKKSNIGKKHHLRKINNLK